MGTKKSAAAEVVEPEAQVPAVQGDQSVGMPDDLSFLEADAGLGSNNVETDDLAIPLLTILQKGSPEVNEDKDQYIPGAKAGMVKNSVTGEVFSGKEGILVVPVAYVHSFLEWKPRETGGGLVNKFSIDQARPLLSTTQRNDKNKDVLPNGNILENTAEHFVLRLLEDGTFETAVVPMKSSALKVSKKWNTVMRSVVLKRKDGTPYIAPTFLMKYLLTTVFVEKNGNDWYNWSVTPAGQVPNMALYNVAKEFSIAVGEGRVSAAVEQADDEPASADDRAAQHL